MGFYYGELLWTLANWKDAAEQYTKVVEMKPDGKYVKEAAYAAVLAWKNALNVDDHEQKELVEKDREKHEKKKEQNKLEPHGDPRVPEEDDRGLRHVHQVRPRRAGAGDDQVPQGAHLLRVQPLRRGREAVRGHRQQAPEARARRLLGEPAARLTERAGQDEGGREVRRQVPRDARADEGSGVRQADDLAEVRHLRHRGHGVREAAQLQGVRPLEAGRRRGAARSPEARRAAVERRPVLPERAPGRPGAQGAPAADQGAPERPLAQKALFRVAAGYHQLAYYSKAAEYYEDFAQQVPGREEGDGRAR